MSDTNNEITEPLINNIVPELVEGANVDYTSAVTLPKVGKVVVKDADARSKLAEVITSTNKTIEEVIKLQGSTEQLYAQDKVLANAAVDLRDGQVALAEAVTAILDNQDTLADKQYVDNEFQEVRDTFADKQYVDNEFQEVRDTFADKQYVDNEIQEVKNSLGNHNGIFRGKCLNGSTGTMYPTLPIGNTKSLPGGGYTINQVLANIKVGNFDDIYIGDYFIDSDNKVYRIAGLDTEWGKSSQAGSFTIHHAVIVTDFDLTIMCWNTKDITAGGYRNSAVQAYCDGDGQAAIESVFGKDHVLTVMDLFSSEIDDSATSPGNPAWQGRASNYSWYNHKVRLMNEIEVFGLMIFSNYYDVGSSCRQLPLFRLMPQLVAPHGTYWLSGIASKSKCCMASKYGHISYGDASYNEGVRVRFLVG